MGDYPSRIIDCKLLGNLELQKMEEAFPSSG
jgi:hypothetical protein